MIVTHPFEPVYNNKSKILILGSFPSVKSREINFYYGHPQNRFWKILENIFNEKIQNNIETKKEFLLKYHIALWDTIKSCQITASSDSSIKKATPNNIDKIILNSNIQAIFCNGNTSYKIFLKFYKDKINIPIICLPSSSPANAKYSLENLTNIWKNQFKEYINV